MKLHIFFVLFYFYSSITTDEIALFPSSGCYSHDVMMTEVGNEFDSDNVTWVQLYLYEFGFGEVKLPNNWNKILINRVSQEGYNLQEYASTLLWELLIPFDQAKPWDIRGNLLFLNILQMSQKECSRFLKSGDFYSYVMNTKSFDLVVIDHFIQECITTMASLLNTTTVQFSNWPIADGYITSLNIPANPSYVAKTGTTNPNHGMTFFKRIHNTIFHILIVIARTIETYVINSFYASIGHSQVELNSVEANHLLYAGRGEFLAEPIRPINNRIKHFGCTTCKLIDNYQIKVPKFIEKNETEMRSNIISDDNERFLNTSYNNNFDYYLAMHRTMNKSLTLLLDCDSTISCRKLTTNSSSISTTTTTTRSTISRAYIENKPNISYTAAELQFLQVQQDYPNIDFYQLENKKFILISFGSVSKVSSMRKQLFFKFIDAFKKLNFLVIWALNSSPEKYLTNQELRSIPKNINLIQWAPVKLLLAHKNLEFFICHGGINTVNELLAFGVPIVGIPLQGDQPSNLNRVVELGIGKMIGIHEVWHNRLQSTINRMLKNLDYHKKRAKLISSMINSYHLLIPNQQHFWLNWAKKYGEKLKNSRSGPRIFNFFYRWSMDYFAILDVCFYLGLFAGIIVILL